MMFLWCFYGVDKSTNVFYFLFPQTEFGKYLDIRNDIAHRCSYSKENRMRITTIKKEDVLGFMNMINHFVEELMNNIKEHFDISNK